MDRCGSLIMVVHVGQDRVSGYQMTVVQFTCGLKN